MKNTEFELALNNKQSSTYSKSLEAIYGYNGATRALDLRILDGRIDNAQKKKIFSIFHEANYKFAQMNKIEDRGFKLFVGNYVNEYFKEKIFKMNLDISSKRFLNNALNGIYKQYLK